jgi:hypothetical protein
VTEIAAAAADARKLPRVVRSNGIEQLDGPFTQLQPDPSELLRHLPSPIGAGRQADDEDALERLKQMTHQRVLGFGN